MHLALSYVTEARHRKPQPLEHRCYDGRLPFGHRARTVQRRRLQQHVGHGREHHTAQHIVPHHIAPERGAQQLAATVEERLHVAKAHPGHEVHGEHVAGLDQAAQVECSDPRNAVLAEHHLAHLAGHQPLAFVGAHREAVAVELLGRHLLAGSPQLERPAHADVVQTPRPARIGGQRPQRRLQLAEGKALGQKLARDGASHGHDNHTGPLEAPVGQAQRERGALGARRLHGCDLAFHALFHPRRSTSRPQAIEHGCGLVRERV